MVSPRTIELAQALIGFNTVSRESNLALIHFVRDELARLGVPSRLTFNAERSKANLLATLGEGRPAGLILSGHTDTVPWDGQDWSVDPLGGVLANSPQGPALFGRGSADMKGFIALALAQAERFLNGRSPLGLHLALSYDEEVGCFGARELIADLREAGIRPLACWIGEPTGLVPALSHKGVRRWRCCVRGKAAHSSLTPQSVNAVEAAARLVASLADLGDELRQQGPFEEGFDVPHSTVSVGQFHGGIADNVVPAEAVVRYEIRDLPGTDVAALQARVLATAERLSPAMVAVDPQAGFRFDPICDIPNFLGQPEAGITRLLQRLRGQAQDTTRVAFGTEAGLFQQAGIPTVVCGPGFITQAHQPDEFVSLAQLGRCEQLLQALADDPLPELMCDG